MKYLFRYIGYLEVTGNNRCTQGSVERRSEMLPMLRVSVWESASKFFDQVGEPEQNTAVPFQFKRNKTKFHIFISLDIFNG